MAVELNKYDLINLLMSLNLRQSDYIRLSKIGLTFFSFKWFWNKETLAKLSDDKLFEIYNQLKSRLGFSDKSYMAISAN